MLFACLESRAMVKSDGQQGYSILEILVAAALIGIVSAMTLPMSVRAVGDLRLRGDARAVSNTVALAKMRAASAFTRARVFVDLSSDVMMVQTWNKADETWDTEGGSVSLSSGVTFGFGGLTEPPPDTQAAIAQSPQCLDDDGEPLGNTACVVFNSRGIPIDSAGAPMGDNALYITDGVGVYGTTLTATPLVRLWWSPSNTTAWVKQ
jgi:prepilin-type N-terminal cleavage/methylation domain-containing protein